MDRAHETLAARVDQRRALAAQSLSRERRRVAAEIDGGRMELHETGVGDRRTGAGSSVGSFGVQIARASGCNVIATASVHAGATIDKLACAREIGASVALDSRRDDFTDAVMAATNGEGVDVVLDHVGTPLWASVIRTLRPWGRYVTTGVTAGHHVDLHLGQVFVKGLTITGVGRPSDAQIQRTLVGLLSLVASGDVVPRIAATFPLARIGEAHALMASDDFFGKIVLTV